MNIYSLVGAIKHYLKTESFHLFLQKWLYLNEMLKVVSRLVNLYHSLFDSLEPSKESITKAREASGFNQNCSFDLQLLKR